ncbi:MAG: amidophosphoribosyltransferase, partial [Methanobacteriales archaeon]|nr:amidophosphoribosyltransferase [Methanobacteriales archaeon]
ISTSNGKRFYTHKGMGLVYEVFNGKKLKKLKGNIGIGHVRYSTTGKSRIENSQPFHSRIDGLDIAIAHNGDIVNSWELRRELEKGGYTFKSTTDSEVISHLIRREYRKDNNMIKAIERTSKHLIGSYSLVILFNHELYAVRDPLGIKPLALAEKDGTRMVASESVAFDVIGAEYRRDVQPGEIIHLNNEESHIIKGSEKMRRAHCMFEYVYFARPDSIIDGRNVYEVRLEIGRALHREHPADVDVVMPVPDSAITAAIGYSRESGIPYGEGLIKNRYVGRTFIMPTQEERETAVKLKMNPIKSELKG